MKKCQKIKKNVQKLKKVSKNLKNVQKLKKNVQKLRKKCQEKWNPEFLNGPARKLQNFQTYFYKSKSNFYPQNPSSPISHRENSQIGSRDFSFEIYLEKKSKNPGIW